MKCKLSNLSNYKTQPSNDINCPFHCLRIEDQGIFYSFLIFPSKLFYLKSMAPELSLSVSSIISSISSCPGFKPFVLFSFIVRHRIYIIKHLLHFVKPSDLRTAPNSFVDMVPSPSLQNKNRFPRKLFVTLYCLNKKETTLSNIWNISLYELTFSSERLLANLK